MKTIKMKNQRNIIIISVIAIILIFLTFVFSSKKITEEEIITVSLTKPIAKETEDELNLTGEVTAWQESIIGSELSGVKIQDILVDVGQTIKKGQILAVLNSETIQAELLIAKSGLLESEGILLQAKENADRARSLDNTKALSEQQMQQYLTAEKTAKAKLESAKANVGLKKVKLEQTKIKAPDDGIISERKASVGNLVNGELFKIIRQEKLQWKPEIDVTDIESINKGQIISIIDKSGGKIKAKVSEISPSVNPITRKGTIIVDLPKELHKNKIQMGMYLNGKIKLNKRESLFVPELSVIKVKTEKDSYGYIFILEEKNRVKKVKVELGKTEDDMMEIKYGIESSDAIIIGDVEKLDDDDIVIVKSK